MDEFEVLYREVRAEKRKRVKSFKKVEKFSNGLGMLCKGLNLFSKSVADGTVERIVKSIADSD